MKRMQCVFEWAGVQGRLVKRSAWPNFIAACPKITFWLGAGWVTSAPRIITGTSRSWGLLWRARTWLMPPSLEFSFKQRFDSTWVSHQLRSLKWIGFQFSNLHIDLPPRFEQVSLQATLRRDLVLQVSNFLNNVIGRTSFEWKNYNHHLKLRSGLVKILHKIWKILLKFLLAGPFEQEMVFTTANRKLSR